MTRTQRWLGPVVADLACVLVFALAGMRSHDEGGAAGVVLAIAWPFALAALLAHLFLRWRGWPALRAWPGGATVVAVTYVLGMALRALSGRGLAPGFLVVAAVFLAVTMLGWRGIAALVARRRSTTAHGDGGRRSPIAGGG